MHYAQRVGAFLGNLIFIHFFCVLFLTGLCERIKLIRTNIYKVLQFIKVNLPSVNGT